LKALIRRLLAGDLTIESNATLQTIYGVHMTTTPDEWRRRLPKMCVWFDYTSIPQPNASPEAGALTSSDHRSFDDQLMAAVNSIPSYVERCARHEHATTTVPRAPAGCVNSADTRDGLH
jgi:hypothetical protein